MATSYTDNPVNMADIMEYIITDKIRCTQEIVLSERCFFYDTCSFRKHVSFQNAEYFLEFIKKKNGIIVVTRTIIMELASASKELNWEYVEYFKKMYVFGIKVLVIYEEDIFDVLSQYFTSNARINQCLDVAVKVAKNKTGTVTEVLKSYKSLREDMMSVNNTDATLFLRFFSTVRSHKESGDSLGEEMISICIHMLAHIPEIYNYKYIVITEDKGAIRLINKTQKNIFEYLEKKVLTAVTTIALGQKIYQESIVTNKEQIMEIISTGIANHIVKIVASEEYDLEPQEKTMTCCELADKIVKANTIHIYY